MISFRGVSRSFGVHEVLKRVDWAITPRSRSGLVGPNGSGKTTLLRLIAGQEEPDKGRLTITPGISIGYLPQEGARLAAGTVLEALLAPFAEVAAMEKEMERLHHELTTATGGRLETLIRRLGDLQHRFEAAGGFHLETQAKVILGGLGFSTDDHARPLQEFSGGYRMRAALGALLLRQPDFLLLDEPTNHLDLEAIAWLERYLADSRSALVIVSHDRTFLNRLVSTVAEIDNGEVHTWSGNYDRYREQKEAARQLALKRAVSEAHRVQAVERFIERFRYKATKARQVQSRIKMLEKMERTEVMAEESSWRFNFPSVPRSSNRVVLMQGVRKSYGDRPVLQGAALDIWRGDRIALLGPNGCGKSTLLRLVAGKEPANDGVIEIGDRVILHYFAQHVLETLTPGRTVLEEMQAWSPGHPTGRLRSLLGIFQFSGDDVFKRVEVLSGGEKNRLALARLTLNPGNLLLLDEPTNHLDLPTREALEEALAGYGGTLLFVSHDRYFINKVATRVAVFRDGRLAVYDGGYDDYLATAEREGRRPSDEPVPSRGKAVSGRMGPAGSVVAREGNRGHRPRRDKRAEAEARNRRNRRLRSFRERVSGIEADILPLETRLKEVEGQMASAETYKTQGLARQLGEEKKSIEIELAHLYDEWDQATADLQAEEARDS